MKTLLALVTALSLGTALAQNGWEDSTTTNDTSSGTGGYSKYFNIAPQRQEAPVGQRHMVEFSAQSLPSAIYAIQRAKTKGSSAETDTSSTLNLNYAYTIHPNLQIGGRFNYFNGIFANNDVERLDVQVGGWFNTMAGDLANSPYASLHLGTGYAQTFGYRGARDDLWIATLAIGKRFSLDSWVVKHISWTPEIALTTVNSTNDSSFDYRQATEFRLLQFSVLW
jgi:hypothetical protein